jgi:PAS domain S-box-containing protein
VHVNDHIDGSDRPDGPHAPDPGWLLELVHGLGAIVFEADAQTFAFTFVSRRAEDVLGFPVEAWLDDPAFFMEHVHPADRDRVVRISQAVVDEGNDRDFECRMTASNGRTAWMRIVIRLVPDGSGGGPRLQGLMTDVSERHRTTEALRESEERFRRLSDATMEGVAIHDDGVILEVNRAYSEMFGYEPEELIGVHLLDLVVPEDRETLRRAIERGDEAPYETTKVRKDGTRFVAESAGRSIPLMGRMVRVGTIRDVTDRRSAEDQLRAAEERFRTLVEQLPATVFISDAEEGSRVLYMSPYHERLTGYPVERFMEDPYFWRTTIHPEDRDRALAEARRTDRTGEPFMEEYRLVRADGSVAWVHEHTILVGGEDGRPRWWQGVIMDVTDRKEAEQELREAEAKYRTLLEQIPAAVYLMPPDDGTKILYMSRGSESLTGFRLEDFEADPDLWEKQLHPEDRERVVAEARRTDRTGEPFEAEYRMFGKDGRLVWTRELSVLVRDEDGTPLFWQGISFDITELKLAEQELALALEREQEAAQRLRVLDEIKTTFLEAVSHDLRTPLTAILGAALTVRNPDIDLAPEDAEDLMDRLIDNARKLDRMLSDLLDLDRLSRGIVEPKRRPLDVSAAVRATIDQAQDLVGDHPVRLEGSEPVAGVLDAAKLERILENLLANAARHTPSGTPIWVRVERQPRGVLLVVEDSGPGVPPQLRGAIFDPFRQGGAAGGARGSGIGLSLVARFAELHGGRAWVDERRGGGASFKVFLRDT